MHVEIRVKLSAAGQKASILAGGDGKDVATLTVQREDAEFAAALDAAAVSATGQAVIDRNKYSCPAWDTLPTATEILAQIAAEKVAAAAEEDRKRIEVRDRTQLVIDQKKTTNGSKDYESADYEGVRGTADWWPAIPDWPYTSDESVRNSPAGLQFTAECEALTAERKLAAQAAALENAKKNHAAKLAAEEAACVKADARAAIVAERQLRDGDLDLNIESGALTQVPRGCWKSHSRGKNWLAVISVSPSSPGGLARDFFTKAKGDSYYLLSVDLQPGDAIEFGADYYSGSGRKSPTRWYGYVVRVEDSYLVIHEKETGKAACKAGAEYAKNPIPCITKQPVSEVDQAIVRVNAEGAIVAPPSAN